MNKQFEALIRIYYSIKLRYKLLLSYLILIILPLTVFTVYSYNKLSNTQKDQLLYSAGQVLEQTGSFLNYKINDFIHVTDLIAVDKSTVNRILKKDVTNEEYPAQLQDAIDLNFLIVNAKEGSDVNSIEMYLAKDTIYSYQNSTFLKLEQAAEYDWYKKLKTSGKKIVWFPSTYYITSNDTTEDSISAVRYVKDLDNYSDILGIVRIDIFKSKLDSIVKNACTTKNSVAYIQNSEGTIISASDYSLLMNIDRKAIAKELKSANSWDKFTIGGKDIIIGSKELIGTDWILVSILPYEDIWASSSKNRIEMFILMLILATIANIFAIFISNSIINRMRYLIKGMKTVQSGNLDINMKILGTDEISELVQNFNYMVNKMREFIQIQYKSGQEVKSAELKALQAQINPHFLYNTLDLINWAAIRNNVPEIVDIVKALAKFYKLSLSRGQNIISIKDEIEHVETYVKIQNYRFKNKIGFVIEVDQELNKFSIMKLVLQPIAENSIIHGICEKDGKTGTIKLSGRMHDDIIILAIEDDGIGMTEEMISEILNDDVTRDSHGYGVKNINNRLKLFYGNQYGLFFKSILGKGTIVEIRIPALRFELEGVE